MSLCKYCVTGVVHEGTAEGKFEKIGGIDSYIATPEGDYPKDAVILHLIDIFGLGLVNHHLIADSYARNGFKVVIPDILFGDPCPLDALDGTSGFDFGAWLGKHPGDAVKPILEKVVNALKEQGITKFGVIGYCYGARAAFDLAFLGVPTAVTINHPSLLQVPADFEKYKATSKAPLFVNSCEIDPMFPAENQKKADEIMAGFGPGYTRDYYEGCHHGFTIRGDLNDPKIKNGKEAAFKATVEFFINNL